MRSSSTSLLVRLLVIQCLAFVALSSNFDFFYFVQQWSPSYCNTKQGCCYPVTGKPAEDFGIHSLSPVKKDGSIPTFCSSNALDINEIAHLNSSLQENWPELSCPSGDGFSFWSHEWNKHGTCSESELDQPSYFEHALRLKGKANILQALNNAGIIMTGDGKQYEVASIKAAIKEEIGYYPFIECNEDPQGKLQFYQVYTCVDKPGVNFIECPSFPDRQQCGLTTTFPSFPGISVI